MDDNMPTMSSSEEKLLEVAAYMREAVDMLRKTIPPPPCGMESCHLMRAALQISLDQAATLIEASAVFFEHTAGSC